MIALGAGDRAAAMRAAIQARKSLPNEPLTHLLRAQAAQLSGDRTTARRIFEAMLATPDTEQLGLRGLHLEAQREGEMEAARHFAERAVALNPKLAWAVDALFDLQCRQSDWAGALETLSRCAQARPHRAGEGRPPARRALDRAGARRRGERSRARAQSGARSARAGARPRAGRRRSPGGCSPRAGIRRAPPRSCSGRGAAHRIPISPPPTPMRASATARATASTASSSSPP